MVIVQSMVINILYNRVKAAPYQCTYIQVFFLKKLITLVNQIVTSVTGHSKTVVFASFCYPIGVHVCGGIF